MTRCERSLLGGMEAFRPGRRKVPELNFCASTGEITVSEADVSFEPSPFIVASRPCADPKSGKSTAKASAQNSACTWCVCVNKKIQLHRAVGVALCIPVIQHDHFVTSWRAELLPSSRDDSYHIRKSQRRTGKTVLLPTVVRARQPCRLFHGSVELILKARFGFN